MAIFGPSSDTDVAKMDAIDALDSSVPQPKKKRERKTPTKSPAKTDVQPPQSSRTSNEKDTALEGDVTQTPAKNVKAKKNRSKKTASLNSSDAMNPNTDPVEVRPSPPVPSPSKETLKEENGNVVAQNEVKTDQRSEKKKKKKQMNEDTVGEHLKEAVQDVINGNKAEKNKKSKISDKKVCNDHVNKKEDKGAVDDSKESICNVEIESPESLVQEKKSKKKKKNTDENILEQKTETEINSEKTAEEESTVHSKKAKKKKKKDKIDEDNLEKTSREEEMQAGEAEPEENPGDENSEQISNEKKRKKKRKHREENLDEQREHFEERKDEENVTNPSECTDKEENQQTADVNHKSKKGSSKKNNSLAHSLLPDHETLGSPSEKKKSECTLSNMTFFLFAC